jgi:hypothetical protein
VGFSSRRPNCARRDAGFRLTFCNARERTIRPGRQVSRTAGTATRALGSARRGRRPARAPPGLRSPAPRSEPLSPHQVRLRASRDGRARAAERSASRAGARARRPFGGVAGARRRDRLARGVHKPDARIRWGDLPGSALAARGQDVPAARGRGRGAAHGRRASACLLGRCGGRLARGPLAGARERLLEALCLRPVADRPVGYPERRGDRELAPPGAAGYPGQPRWWA